MPKRDRAQYMREYRARKRAEATTGSVAEKGEKTPQAKSQ